MIEFMDYVVQAFHAATDWNPDNSYSSLTATSDALLSFPTPSTLALHVSSLATPNFATSYTLSTLGQIDGSISYLYSTVPLGHIPSQAPIIPLRCLVRGYRDIKLPLPVTLGGKRTAAATEQGKPTLLLATLALPPPSVLTALYARRISPETLVSFSLYSKSVPSPALASGPPPAAVLAHFQHDTGRYSIEGLGSTDNALLGVRGLWNFGLSPQVDEEGSSIPLYTPETDPLGGFTEFPSGFPLPPYADTKSIYRNRLASKPSLLSAGAEFYYSPFSHVIGLSTGLRFTTLAPHITPTEQEPASSRSSPSLTTKELLSFRGKPLAGTSASLLSTAGHTLLTPSNVSHSSFPYTMTLTLTPLTGSISSTYSVRPTPTLALSSQFDFNFYSWESRYVIGGELWRPYRRRSPTDTAEDSNSSTLSSDDNLVWVRSKTKNWFSPAEQSLKDERLQREEENVWKFRLDDSWNVKALWTGRVKSLLVSAGVSVSPITKHHHSSAATLSAGDGVGRSSMEGDLSGLGPNSSVKRWMGSVGVSIAYST
ncbi:Mitochondrial distribution and morphology protein 10 [Exophiala dermatitidis]